MDANRFDTMVRSLTASLSRRRLTRGLVAGPIGLTALRFAAGSDARKNGKKKRKKPLPFNQFGCLNVGQKCRGKDSTCCSGLCQGKKAKKGKKDKTRCIAHNTGACTPERSLCGAPDPLAAMCNTGAFCFTTTGGAGFCGSTATFSGATNCRQCSKDTDCEAAGFGVGAACVLLPAGANCGGGCAGINGSNGTACLPAGA